MKTSLLGATAVVAILGAASASAVAPPPVAPAIAYVPGSIAESTIAGGPWTLHQVSPVHDASGVKPPSTEVPPYTGTGTPYVAYCTQSLQQSRNTGANVMQPFYFPFVHTNGLVLEGFFDYRPRNEQEALVAATSSDLGKTWTFGAEALALNPYCPWDMTDPDNLNVAVPNAAHVPVKTAYGSDPNNAADNGLGHPVLLNVNGHSLAYQLNRANGFIDSAPLVVHTLPANRTAGLLPGLPAYGYVSPLASGGYPTLTTGYQLTSGLINPDAFIGALTLGGKTTVVYVSKDTSKNADTNAGYPACPPTPPYALTNLINGAPRKANHDVITVYVATTTDGINFTQVGATTGLFNPATTSYSGTRWLGSGSLLRLANGHVGMLFGAGNCLDNDSDGFHYVGYAETTSVVNTPNDLLSWTVFNDLDHPILSTDRVIDTSVTPNRAYPANPPVVNVSSVNALTLAQVAPFMPPVSPPAPPAPTGGYTANFFSGRVYDPQAIYTDPQTVTIVFAGYNTPQPSNNLGDYRSIGRFQLQFPAGYLLGN